jgi:hypothetical protein
MRLKHRLLIKATRCLGARHAFASAIASPAFLFRGGTGIAWIREFAIDHAAASP